MSTGGKEAERWSLRQTRLTVSGAASGFSQLETDTSTTQPPNGAWRSGPVKMDKAVRVSELLGVQGQRSRSGKGPDGRPPPGPGSGSRGRTRSM